MPTETLNDESGSATCNLTVTWKRFMVGIEPRHYWEVTLKSPAFALELTMNSFDEVRALIES